MSKTNEIFKNEETKMTAETEENNAEKTLAKLKKTKPQAKRKRKKAKKTKTKNKKTEKEKAASAKPDKIIFDNIKPIGAARKRALISVWQASESQVCGRDGPKKNSFPQTRRAVGKIVREELLKILRSQESCTSRIAAAKVLIEQIKQNVEESKKKGSYRDDERNSDLIEVQTFLAEATQDKIGGVGGADALDPPCAS